VPVGPRPARYYSLNVTPGVERCQVSITERRYSRPGVLVGADVVSATWVPRESLDVTLRSAVEMLEELVMIELGRQAGAVR